MPKEPTEFIELDYGDYVSFEEEYQCVEGDLLINEQEDCEEQDY